MGRGVVDSKLKARKRTKKWVHQQPNPRLCTSSSAVPAPWRTRKRRSSYFFICRDHPTIRRMRTRRFTNNAPSLTC